MRIAMLLVMALLFTAGCAPKREHPTKSDQQSQADYDECLAQDDPEKAHALSFLRSLPGYSDDLGRRMHNNWTKLCLRKKACAGSDVKACSELIRAKGGNAAVEPLRKACQSGERYGCNALALALAGLRYACDENDHLESCANVGAYLMEFTAPPFGLGSALGPADVAVAQALLRKACDGGELLSCNGLFFGPSLASATPQYTLSGSYAGDKNEFFPNGRDAEAEALLMAALKEGSSKFIICLDARSPGGSPECIPNYEPLPEDIGGTIEEQLALEYDMGAVSKAFAVSSGHPINHEQLGVVLGRVGLWEEALRAFYEGLKTGRHVVFRGKKHVIPEPGMWGAVGVAAHVLGRYDGSVRAFDKALALDATYFDTRKIQRKIREASHSGHFVWER